MVPVILLAVLIVVSAAGAGSSFNGNVCQLVSAKQATAVLRVSSKCVNAKPLPGPGSTMYTGNWAGKTTASMHLLVTVSAYTDTGALQLAKRNLNQGLPGAPKKLAGVGAAAYQATGAGAAAIRFSVGKYIAFISLNSVSTQPKVTPQLVALAKATAAKL
jgi:hypothetical protein